MKYLILLLMGCGSYYPPFGDPSFINRDIYCEPIHEDAMICREDNGMEHRCDIVAGRWECRIITDSCPNLFDDFCMEGR